jgi:hypothetical protein
MACLEEIARAVQNTQARGAALSERSAPMLDIVFMIETGGRMQRLLADAAESITGFARVMKTALPPPDVRFGCLQFSADDRLQVRDLAESPAAFVTELRQPRAAVGAMYVTLEAAMQKLLTYSWRPGSHRIVIVYMASPIRAVPRAIEQLRGPGIKLITIPADGASTQTHEVLQAMASRSGGNAIIPDYLVRYTDNSSGAQKRAFYLYKRSLYPLAHDVAEQNWQDIYELDTTGARSYRAGSIDESCEILGRSGARGIRIQEIRSTLDRACAEAVGKVVASASPAHKGLSFPAPDTLMRFQHARRTYLIPVASAHIRRIATPQNTSWLGFAPVVDSQHEDGFFPHPASMVLLPTAYKPARLVLLPWREIAAYARMGAGLFDPARVFVEASGITLSPMQKKRFVVAE